MARAKMVTRTMQTTHATVLAVDKTSAEVLHLDVDLPRTYKDEKSMEKVARKLVETDDVKFVSVESYTVEEILYGMDEAKFIKEAEVLPSRN